MTPLKEAMPRVARYTWRLHWPAAMVAGAGYGIIGLSAFVFKRSLGAPEHYVPGLIAIWQATWILAPVAGNWMERADPQRLWRWIGVASGLPLVMVAVVDVEPRPWLGAGAGSGNFLVFVLLLGVHYLVGVFYIPHRGALMRTNYPIEVRGRMFGLREALAIVGMITTARIAQHLLDQDPRWLRVLFPVAGLLFGGGLFLKGRIRWRHQRRPKRKEQERGGIGVALRDKRFLVYEGAFMFYGFGFLMAWPLLVIFMESELRLDYNEYTWAQSVAMPVAQLTAIFFWGRLADRIGVVRMVSVAFSLLVFFLCAVPHVTGLQSLILVYVLFGGSMAGVMIGWSLGPLHFAPEGRGHAYTAVHFSFVGIRSVIAPFLGYAVKVWTGSYALGFYAAAGFMLLGALTMAYLARMESAVAVEAA